MNRQSDSQSIKTTSRKRALIWMTAVIVFHLLEGCRSNDQRATSAPPTPVSAPAISGAAPVSYAEVVNRVAPAVVTIRSERRVRAPRQHPFFDDPLFRDFFGGGSSQPAPRNQIQLGLGSGVIITAAEAYGYVVTNHHVVDGAEGIKVELTNNRVYEAKVVGLDPRSDLAVLKIMASDLAPLTLGDSDRVRVGDVVLAVGNPLGLGQTVTAGIISALGRTTGLSDGSFESFLQTDAPINQGNSGGALVNTASELVGINSQILSPTGGNIGIGFAIPANMAKNVAEQLIKSGKVRRGYLGIMIQPMTSETATKLGLNEPRAALVHGVEKGSPAERAGLKQNDVIVAFNGNQIVDANNLRNLVASAGPSAEVTLTILREGREQQLSVTLDELSNESGRSVAPSRR